MKRILLFLSLIIVLQSCIPGEDPVQPFDRGDVVEGAVTMGPTYNEQLYFSLELDSVIKHNNLYIWDLGFSCIDSTYEIILNYGKFMAVLEIPEKPFEDVTIADTTGSVYEDWRFDNPMGKTDSTALGQWWKNEDGKVVSLNKVYIIDRGTNDIGKGLGFVKFQVLKFEDDTYTVRYANLKGNIPYQHEIKKNNKYNYIHLSFEKEGKIEELEPPRNEWDLLFSKYTDLLYTSTGESMWYSVSGAYLNPNNMACTRTIIHDFQSINSTALDTLTLYPYRNALGHDWKDFDLGEAKYVVYPQVVYFIKGVTGFYYKFHFIDFYDTDGNKGVPKFEFQKL